MQWHAPLPLRKEDNAKIYMTIARTPQFWSL